jgi:hypothetical protein
METHTFTSITEYSRAGFPDSYSYSEFRQLVRDLIVQGKSTGHEQSESLLEYSKLNEHRMARWDKHFHIPGDLEGELKGIRGGYSWLVITEGWCGDSSQILPIISAIASVAGVNLRIVLRDDNLWLMDQYLTDGKRSIPVLICLDAEGKEIFRWGSRPALAQNLFLKMKNSTDPTYSYSEIKEAIHLWYARDRGVAIQNEVAGMMRKFMV